MNLDNPTPWELQEAEDATPEPASSIVRFFALLLGVGALAASALFLAGFIG